MRSDLRVLSPLTLQKQLRSRGFQPENGDGRVVMYRRGADELDLPLRTDFADYSRRVEELIGILAALEGVPPTDLLDTLLQAERDAVALRVESPVPMTGTGTIPIDGLADAVAAMRDRMRTKAFEVIGHVTRLDRSAPHESGGDVTLTPTEGEARDIGSVTVRLGQEDYLEAIEAHRQGTKVRVLGTLEKKGRRWTLSEPTGFERCPDTNED